MSKKYLKCSQHIVCMYSVACYCWKPTAFATVPWMNKCKCMQYVFVTMFYRLWYSFFVLKLCHFGQLVILSSYQTLYCRYVAHLVHWLTTPFLLIDKAGCGMGTERRRQKRLVLHQVPSSDCQLSWQQYLRQICIIILFLKRDSAGVKKKKGMLLILENVNDSR